MLDNHYANFHGNDPDGHGGARELELSLERLQKYQIAFPEAIVCLGNHDRIPARQAFNAGLSTKWIRSVKDMIDYPGWKFVIEIVIDGVKYLHGEARVAHRRAEQDKVSVVQGHYHTNSSIRFQDGEYFNTFSMQVGCGFDKYSYAAAYAKGMQNQSISCGVVLDDGTLPILERMAYYGPKETRNLRPVN